jgi:hypothetical protein
MLRASRLCFLWRGAISTVAVSSTPALLGLACCISVRFSRTVDARRSQSDIISHPNQKFVVYLTTVWTRFSPGPSLSSSKPTYVAVLVNERGLPPGPRQCRKSTVGPNAHRRSRLVDRLAQFALCHPSQHDVGRRPSSPRHFAGLLAPSRAPSSSARSRSVLSRYRSSPRKLHLYLCTW